jgi:hypothetical protein
MSFIGARLATVALTLLVASRATAQSSAHTVDSPARQIAAAVSPLPKPLRSGATVLGYDSAGRLATLRTGTNDLVCLADDPRGKRFHVACYYKALEPFMARGRALRTHLSADSADSVRAREIRAGQLAMPRQPTALYQYVAPRDSVDLASGKVRGATFLYLVYMPFATPETTGLSAVPLTDGGPWLMYPGKPWAHIMIAPVKAETITLDQ